MIAQHHEHADGSGFPLQPQQRPDDDGGAHRRLVNRYDNLCNPHLLAKAMTPHEALSLLFAQGKPKFDTSILDAFIKMMGVYPPGSTVQLTDDRYALVVGVNSSRPLKPQRDRPRARCAARRGAGARPRADRGPRHPAQHQADAVAADRLDYLSPRPRVAYFFEPVRVEESVA